MASPLSSCFYLEDFIDEGMGLLSRLLDKIPRARLDALLLSDSDSASAFFRVRTHSRSDLKLLMVLASEYSGAVRPESPGACQRWRKSLPELRTGVLYLIKDVALR